MGCFQSREIERIGTNRKMMLILILKMTFDNSLGHEKLRPTNKSPGGGNRGHSRENFG